MSGSHTHSVLDDARASIGATPVGDPPAGEDIRDDPAYEELEAEFRKMESGGPGAVDWKMVNDRTLDLLANRSKDLLLASRLAYGLYREESYRGMAVGLSILNGMVAEHWDGLFPPAKRERGRAGSFDWLAEKLAPVVEATPPADGEAAYALAAHDMLVELDGVLDQKLTKFPVALGPLVRALRPYAAEVRTRQETSASPEAGAQEREEEPEEDTADTAPAETGTGKPATENAEADTAPPAPEPVATGDTAPTPEAPPPAVPPAPASASAPPPPTVDDIPTDAGVDKSLQSLFSAAGKVATAVRQQAPHDPRAYLCARLAVWGQITAAPPDSAGKTSLPPPQKAKLVELEALRSAGNSQGLILAAESAFVSAPFWLDAQHALSQAMQASGSGFDAARAAVRGQLAAFLARVPGLTGLSFSDGTPFASTQTLNWIDREVRGSDNKGGEGTAVSALDATKAEAETLGQSGQIVDGLRLMTQHAEACFGERAHFAAQLEIGEYCLRFEVLQPLFPLLDGLRRAAERRELDQWEPELAVALASLSWRALAHKGAARFHDERQSHEQKARIMSTLANLDIVAAARLGTPQSN